jgi:hypothetical protein
VPSAYFLPAIVLQVSRTTLSGTGKQRLVRELPKNRRCTEVAVSYSGSLGAVGRHDSALQLELRCDARVAGTRAVPYARTSLAERGKDVETWLGTAEHWGATMTIPHYVSEDKSDLRGIKPGWYAIDGHGNLCSGPFSNLEECVAGITRAINVPPAV